MRFVGALSYNRVLLLDNDSYFVKVVDLETSKVQSKADYLNVLSFHQLSCYQLVLLVKVYPVNMFSLFFWNLDNSESIEFKIPE